MTSQGLGGLVVLLALAAAAGMLAGGGPASVSAQAQTANAGRDPRMRPSVFRTRVDLVTLDVCVKDRDGRLVPTLKREDFLILENNTPQQVELFLPEGDVPLTVVLLLDRSASMAGEKLRRAQAAASAFLRRLGPDDAVEIMTFNEIADRRVAFTYDLEAAERAVTSITAEGQTGLYEALMAGVRDLQKARRDRSIETREVLLVLSDGEDTSSRPEFDYVLEDVRRSGVLVYVVSLRTDGRDRCIAPPHELLQLAHDSGGRAMAVDDLATLQPLYEEIAAELRRLYRMAYVPSNPVKDGGWRSISVRVPGRNVSARARAGYYATAPLPRFFSR